MVVVPSPAAAYWERERSTSRRAAALMDGEGRGGSPGMGRVHQRSYRAKESPASSPARILGVLGNEGSVAGSLGHLHPPVVGEQVFSDASVQNDLKRWPFKVIAGPGDKPMIVVQYFSWGNSLIHGCTRCGGDEGSPARGEGKRKGSRGLEFRLGGGSSSDSERTAGRSMETRGRGGQACNDGWRGRWSPWHGSRGSPGGQGSPGARRQLRRSGSEGR